MVPSAGCVPRESTRAMAAQDLQDRVVLITGAAGDFGAAMAQRFFAAGASLALTDIDGDALRELAARELAAPDRVFALQLDVSDAERTRDAVNRAAARFGALHGLVNNAAVVTPKWTIADLPVEDWQRVMSTMHGMPENQGVCGKRRELAREQSVGERDNMGNRQKNPRRRGRF